MRENSRVAQESVMKGFIRLPRRLFDTRWWYQKRIFSEVDAIIDLYQRADKFNKTTLSIRSLADSWIWEQTRVLRFLAKLEKEGYIKSSKSPKGTIISILDFGTGATQTATPSATPSATPKTLSTNDLNSSSATPTATPSATQTATLSRVYRNDNNISYLNEEDKNNKTSPIIPFECDDEYSFDAFWDLYDKKVEKNKCEKLYAKLSIEEKKAMFLYIPLYKNAQPNKKYRKNPLTFLNNKSWNDEIINDYATTQTHQQPRSDSDHPSNEQLVRQSYDIIRDLRQQDAQGYNSEILPF